jgi:putative heme transporter
VGEAEEHREEASEMPDGDVAAGRLRQHADITEAIDRVRNARGEDRAASFEALARFLAAHEAAEQASRAPDRPPGRFAGVGDQAVAPALRTITGYVWRLAVLAVVVYVTFTVLAKLHTVVIAVFAALVLTAVLLPVTALFARWMPRGLAAALSLVLAGLVIIGLLAFIGASAARQAGDLTKQLHDGITQITSWLNQGPLKISTTNINNAVSQAQKWISDNRGALASHALSSAEIVLQLLSGLALAVFCSLFFLNGGSRMWDWTVGQLPARSRSRISGALIAGWNAFSGYTRGILIVASTNALVVAIALLILRVPLALPLALLVFFGTFIPLIGAPIAMAVATVVALAGRGPLIALVVLVMIVLVGQFEGNVLHPLIMSRAVSLHPVVVALSVACGAILGGIIGAIVAVPLVSTVWGVAKYLRDTDPEERPTPVAIRR